MDDDSDLAFNLQVEEALAFSLIDGAVSPQKDAPSLPYDAVFGASLSNLIQNDSLYKYEQELIDGYKAEAEAKRMRLDLSRQIHDRAFACDILGVPDAEWGRTGDHLNRPYGEGSSNNNNNNNERSLGFRVYVKGLVDGTAGGVGVAICDGCDGLVFELSKGFREREKGSEELVELKALIEGLNVAVMLDLKSISVVVDTPLLYHYITGKNPRRTANFAPLYGQIDLLLRKFNRTHASLVARKDIKFAVELARNALTSEVNSLAGTSNANKPTKNCSICLEDTYEDQMFLITDCLHSYCFPCMSKHVQFKLLQGMLPKCPSENCKSELKPDSCRKFLSPELFDIMSQRVKEASIPSEQKIYCPYPKCSVLLSKIELRGSMGRTNVVLEVSGARQCPRCSGVFCINCKVPWHSTMSCFDFKRRNPEPCHEDKKLKSLATQSHWRQCPKCNHMVSLATGCYHIYCRCGHEFCYTCGAEWKNKKATCICPIWDERNIVYSHGR